MSVEVKQIRLTLTDDKKTLKQMKLNKVLKMDAKGEVYTRMFDGSIFEFRPGQVLTLNKSIANGLFRDSIIILDDHLTGEMVPCLKKLGEYNLGIEVAPEEASRATSCPICKVDCHSIPRLARHLLAKHKSDRADLFPEEDKDTETAVEKEVAETDNGPESSIKSDLEEYERDANADE